MKYSSPNLRKKTILFEDAYIIFQIFLKETRFIDAQEHDKQGTVEVN